MYAISVRQPWVEQIICGIKTRECRSQATKIRGPIYLYASLTPRKDAAEWRKVGKAIGDLSCGAIAGTVEIVECVANGGGYAYVLAKPRRFRRKLTPKNQP